MKQQHIKMFARIAAYIVACMLFMPKIDFFSYYLSFTFSVRRAESEWRRVIVLKPIHIQFLLVSLVLSNEILILNIFSCCYLIICVCFNANKNNFHTK